MIRTFEAIIVPDISGDGQSQHIRHINFSDHRPSGVGERVCRVISMTSGWQCDKWATGTIRVNGKDYGVCSRHGSTWINGKPIILVREGGDVRPKESM